MKIQWNQITWYSKLCAVAVFVAVFALGLWLGYQLGQAKNWGYKSPKSIVNAATFNCGAGKKISAVFYADSVGLSLSDGRKMDLERAMSGSGARYANQDESIVFWNKGDTAFIEEAGSQTFKDCQINAQAN